MKKIALIACLALAACDPPQTAEPGAATKVQSGAVTLMATAPDGTKLWAVHSFGTTIYFAASGTQHTESCGKACTRTVTTPTAN